MKPCPRCAGCTRPILVITKEDTITATSCLNCGHVGGDALIEHHHSLPIPPEPSRQISTPIYDPTHRRLSYCRNDGPGPETSPDP